MEKSKLLVAEREWCILVRFLGRDMGSVDHHDGHDPDTASSYLLLRGNECPGLRATEQTTAEGLLAVLQSLKGTPSLHSTFKYAVRICEVDEGPANLRCEGLLGSTRPREWSHASFICTAHKCHLAAEKCWSLSGMPQMLGDLIRSSLFLLSPPSMKLLRRGLVAEALKPGAVEIIYEEASPSRAARHRAEMLKLFCQPGHEAPRVHAFLKVLSSRVLNGNWMCERLQHYCAGRECCVSQQHTLNKIVYCLKKLLSVARFETFHRNNWSAWLRGLQCYGLLQSIHQLYEKAFLAAFGNSSQPAQPAVPSTHGHEAAMQVFLEDETVIGSYRPPSASGPSASSHEADPGLLQAQLKRDERAQHQQRAQRMLENRDWFEKLVLLAKFLEPERTLMSVILGNTAASFEVAQQMATAQGSQRLYPILQLADEEHGPVAKMIADSIRNFEVSHWSVCADTEAHRSQVLKLSARPAACAYELLQVRLRGFPHKLLRLVTHRSREVAASVIGAPTCMIDPLSRTLLTGHASPQSLLEDEQLYQTLAGIVWLLQGTTFRVEWRHSRNSRQARSVPQTHRLHIATLGLTGVGVSAPEFLQQRHLLRVERRQGQKRGRPRRFSKNISAEDGAKAVGCSVDNEKAGGKKHRRGGGGPWRAFLHDRIHIQGEAKSFQTLAAEYATLSAEQKEKYVSIGGLGPCTGPAFSPCSSSDS